MGEALVGFVGLTAAAIHQKQGTAATAILKLRSNLCIQETK